MNDIEQIKKELKEIKELLLEMQPTITKSKPNDYIKFDAKPLEVKEVGGPTMLDVTCHPVMEFNLKSRNFTQEQIDTMFKIDKKGEA